MAMLRLVETSLRDGNQKRLDFLRVLSLESPFGRQGISRSVS